MSRRYGERGHGRFGGEEDERYEEREDAQRGAREENYGGRHIRGIGYEEPSRGYAAGREQAAGREYDYGRDYGYGRDYDTRDTVSRDYGARDHGSRDYDAREYGRRVMEGGGYSARGREGEDYARERGRDYERGREHRHERDRRREHERDPNQVRSFDTDYGRTTSRFYGRSGYEFGRDDYDRPNYGPEVTEYRSRRHEEHGHHRDARDARDERDERDERGHGGRGWWDRAADGLLSWFGDDDAARRLSAERGHAGDRGDERGSGRGSGLYRGRGPKNYRRSDDRIREEINDRLTDNDWLDASDIDVSVGSGEVMLSGTVDSRYSKRLAEDIAESVTGVAHVQNNLRVQNYQTGTPSAAAQSGEGVITGDSNVPASDAPTFTDVIKNAVTDASTTTPGIEGSAGTDLPPTGTRASRAGGRG
ncbi:MAG TPA: BON domain-containing protein [Pyrinomonadaceae bacterium]|nr:BON domain-containing protein [Pyrinomonadaceae bacterium]